MLSMFYKTTKAAVPICRHLKAALHALDELNSIAWQHSNSLDISSNASQRGLRGTGVNINIRRTASLEKLERSLSMPEQISRDLAKPLLASAVEEVGVCMNQCFPSNGTQPA